jgi:hypothetical protein
VLSRFAREMNGPHYLRSSTLVLVRRFAGSRFPSTGSFPFTIQFLLPYFSCIERPSPKRKVSRRNGAHGSTANTFNYSINAGRSKFFLTCTRRPLRVRCLEVTVSLIEHSGSDRTNDLKGRSHHRTLREAIPRSEEALVGRLKKCSANEASNDDIHIEN